MKKLKHLKTFEKYDQAAIDKLLDKINEFGEDSLTAIEKEYLSNPNKNTLNPPTPTHPCSLCTCTC